MSIFGPVRSRRLGLSLGVDLVPSKVCSMDCVYCEVGRTTRLTLERAEYRPFFELKAGLKRALKAKNYDVVTLTGSGEPTLNIIFPEVVKLVRKLTDRPIAVLTNSTTLESPEVFSALCEVDYVLASLDAARKESFRKVNRPAAGLDPERIVEALARLREAMSGELWLEILLVKGLNDTPEDIEALKKAVLRIKPHRVQLNTVVRPPADPRAKPLSYAELLALAREFDPEAEVLTPPPERKAGGGKFGEEEILAYLRRRPAPAEELALAFGVSEEEIKRFLENLVKDRKIESLLFNGVEFFRSLSKDL